MHIHHALRIEVLLDLRVAPVDRDAAHQQRFDDLLGGVARVAFVLEGDGELAACKVGPLVGNPAAEIVADSASRIDVLARIEPLEELNPLPCTLIAVDEVAEAVDPASNHSEIPHRRGVFPIPEMSP